MPELIPVLTKGRIQESVAALAARISSDYQNRNLVLIAVLKGAFVFLSDLIRELTLPVRIDFVQIESYGAKTHSSEQLILKKHLDLDIRNMDVLIVEDIVDTGLTMAFLIDYLKKLGPKSIRTCVLLDKRERRRVDIQPDYTCHKVENGFLVGYGLDHDENYRALPEIYRLNT